MIISNEIIRLLFLIKFYISSFFFLALSNDDNPIFKSAQSTINKNNILSNLPTTTASTIPTAKDYHCDICGQTLKLTSIEILRHRATHQT